MSGYCDICHSVFHNSEPVYFIVKGMATDRYNVEFGERINLCERCSDQIDDWTDLKAVIVSDGVTND